MFFLKKSVNKLQLIIIIQPDDQGAGYKGLM